MAQKAQDETAAIEAWIRRHQDGVWRFARVCGCPADVADDVVQEALLAAMHKRIHERDDGDAARWLRGAVGNLWRMHLRTEGRRRRHVDAAVALRAWEQCAADDGGRAWIDALRECLQHVGGRARRLLERRYGDDAQRHEIAEEFGMRPDGVKTMLRRVRAALRACVLRRLESGDADVQTRGADTGGPHAFGPKGGSATRGLPTNGRTDIGGDPGMGGVA